MKISKAIIPLVVTTVFGCFAARRKNSGKSSKAISEIAKFASDATVNAAEKTFGGLKQSAIDEVVSNTSRGLKAVINGDKLEYWYKSASGKHDYISSLTLDSTRKVIIDIVKGHYDANSPRIFAENLIEAMKKAN